MIHKARSLGLDFEKLIESGALEILWQPPTENLLDALGARLLDAVRRRNVRRLFIDGFSGFEDTSFYPLRVSRFFTALANEFRAIGVTTVYSREMQNVVGREVDLERTKVSPIVENFVLLRYVEVGARLTRLLSIIKARDSDYDGSFREFSITRKGLSLDRWPKVVSAATRKSAPKKQGRRK